MSFEPLRFIAEPVEVSFDQPPLLQKTPGCPSGFTWRGETHQVVELIREWQDFSRRGRMGRNMQPQHAVRAAWKGSWGVGQFYFRVRTDSGRIFDLYYDRAPKSADDRKGEWVLYREMIETGPDRSTGS